MIAFLAKWAIYGVLRVLSWTCRFVVLGDEYHTEAKNSSRHLLAFWHEHILSGIFYLEGNRYCALTSDSRDGRIIGFQCEKFGNEVVHGSQNRDGKDKGGLRALIGLLAALKRGTSAAITVDGSVGPRRYVKAGVIELARKSGAPILPFAAAASRYWTLNTWDQFKIPKPFSTIVVQFGPLIQVPAETKKEDIASFQDLVANAINEQEKGALEYLDHGHTHDDDGCCDHEH